MQTPMYKSMLDEERHAGIIANLDRIRETANIQEKYIHTSMRDGVSTDAEIEWVVKFHVHRANGLAGLAMVGVENAEERQMEMCGALLRNFIDARVVPLNTLLAWGDEAYKPDPTVLLIPNLYFKQVGSKQAVNNYKLQGLYDLLLARYTSGKPTVVFIEDLSAMRAAYGDAIVNLIKNHYKIVEA